MGMGFCFAKVRCVFQVGRLNAAASPDPSIQKTVVEEWGRNLFEGMLTCACKVDPDISKRPIEIPYTLNISLEKVTQKITHYYCHQNEDGQ